MGAHSQQEGREQVLEPVAAAENLGVLEQGAGRIALEGLDEPRLQRFLHIGLDGPGPGLHDTGARIIRRGMEADRRTERDDVGSIPRSIMGKDGQVGVAVGVRAGDDRVGRAKIDADRAGPGQGHGRAPENWNGKAGAPPSRRKQVEP